MKQIFCKYYTNAITVITYVRTQTHLPHLVTVNQSVSSFTFSLFAATRLIARPILKINKHTHIDIVLDVINKNLSVIIGWSVLTSV